MHSKKKFRIWKAIKISKSIPRKIQVIKIYQVKTILYQHKKKIDDSREKQKKNNKEHKWKELLYELFYEIKSEILGTKIEIDEDEYQDNIKSITIPKLVKYIHDSIQILIKKKIEESKLEQKEEDKKNLSKTNKKILIQNDEETINHENILKKMENKERYLTKLIFQNKLQKDAMENKISDYMEMEEEFEEMKAKLKYEDGRFLNNDRKDNEIIIIRGENEEISTKKEKEEEGKLTEEAANNSRKLYKEAFDLAEKELPLCNEIRLGLVLNYTVFEFDIMENKKEAYDMALKYYNNSLKILDDDENIIEYENLLLIHEIKDNTDNWISEIEEE